MKYLIWFEKNNKIIRIRFTRFFNSSLQLCKVPSVFKHLTMIPAPKKLNVTDVSLRHPWSYSPSIDWCWASWETPQGSLWAFGLQCKQVSSWCNRHGNDYILQNVTLWFVSFPLPLTPSSQTFCPQNSHSSLYSSPSASGSPTSKSRNNRSEFTQ